MSIRVTMEIIPRGDESRKFVAGVLDIINDGTGDRATGNYKLHLTGPVKDGDTAILNYSWKIGFMKGFRRARGWWSCVREALNAMPTDYDYSPNANLSGGD